MNVARAYPAGPIGMHRGVLEILVLSFAGLTSLAGLIWVVEGREFLAAGCVIFAIVVAAWWFVGFRRSGSDFIAPVPLFAACFAIYALTVPISLTLSLPIDDYRLGPLSDAALVSEALACHIMALLAAFLGYVIPVGRRLANRLPDAAETISDRRLGTITIIYLAMGVVLYSIYLYSVGGWTGFLGSSYGDKYELQYGKGPLLYGITLLQAFIILASYLGFRSVQWRAVSLVSACVYLGISILIGQRSLIVPLVLGLGIIYQRNKGKLKPLTVGAALLITYMVASVIPQFREQQGSFVDRITGMTSGFRTDRLRPANVEFATAFANTMDIIQYTKSQSEPLQFGQTYALGFAHIVPRFLHPQRGVSVAEWFTETFYPQIAKDYGGFGFSPIAEAYLNFGWIGPIFVFLLIGIGLKALESYLERQGRASPAWLVYSPLAYYLVYFHRTDAELMIKSTTAACLPYLIAVLYATRNKRIARGVSSPHTR